MRCFFAIPIDPITQNGLDKKVAQLQCLEWAQEINWIPTENRHLTLRFLGAKIPEEKVFSITQSMNNWFKEGMSYFDAEILNIQPFPCEQNPHTIVAALDATLPLQSLVREIEDHVRPLGFTKSKQAFRPHISLGLLHKSTDLKNIHMSKEIANCDNLLLKVEQITLYQSQLSNNKPPLYTELKSCYLEQN